MSKTYSAGIATAYGAAKQGGYQGSYTDFCNDIAQLGDITAELGNIDAEATTLEAGSSATASYEGGVFSFGIPKGDTGAKGERGETGAKGDKGDTGETGATGATGNGVTSIAKTATVGLVDTYTITFSDGSTTTFTVTNGTAAIDDTLTIAGRAADAKATGDEISDLKSALVESADLLIPLSNLITFVQGDISNSGVVNPNVKYRACTNGIATLPNDTEIIIKSGYRIYVRYFTDEGVYIRGEGWIENRVTLSGKVTITVGKVPESTSAIYTPSELEKGLSYRSQKGKGMEYFTIVESYTVADTENILRFSESTVNVNGVTVKTYPYDRMIFSGTATSSGGSSYKLYETTLQAGNYYILINPETTNGVEIAVKKTSDNSYVTYGSGSFTLATETQIYFGASFRSGNTYNITQRVILVKGSEKPTYIPPVTAVDYVLRKQFSDYVRKKSAPYDLSYPLSVISKNGSTWTQGVCCVGDKMVGFNAGSDDHTTPGTIAVSNVFDTSNVTSVTQNLGHCTSADYNILTDSMIVGNGSTNQETLPIIYIVKNMGEWVDNPTNVEYDGSNVISIDISTIGGYEMVCCFGENESVCYVMTIDADKVITIFKCLLGLGSNNLLTEYQTNSFGAFISGCADNEYNGTLHVLSSYDGGTDITGEIQGLKYLNGKIIMPTDEYVNSVLTSFISILTLDDSTGKIRADRNLWIPIVSADGGIVKTECEDVFFHNGCGYVMTNTTINGASVKRTSKFTLNLYTTN